MHTPIGRWAFVVPVLGAASALAVGLLWSEEDDARRARRPELRDPLVQAAPERPAPAPRGGIRSRRSGASRAAREDLPTGASPERQLIEPVLARRTAGRFVEALLQREWAPNKAAAASTIRAAATPALADFVLATRPRTPTAEARPGPAELVHLELSGSSGRRAAAVASVARGSRTTALLMQLVHRDGRWRVDGLR